MLFRRCAAISVLFIASAAVALPPGPAGATTPNWGGWCADGHTAPCITGASVHLSNGTTVTVSGSADPTYSVDADVLTSEGAIDVSWDVQTVDAFGSLSAADTWSISFDMGTVVPRMTFTRASSVSVRRTHRIDYSTTITGHPTRVPTSTAALDNCDTSAVPWSCRDEALGDTVAFNGDVDDFGQWTDVTQRNALYGFNVSTNIDSTDAPPQVLGAGTAASPLHLLVDLANPYRWHDGTVFHGFYVMDLPTAFLELMGVDSPSTMTSTSLDGSLSSGTISIDPSGSVMHVDASDIVFPNPLAGASANGLTANPATTRFNSQRPLRVTRGVVTPTRPTITSTRRVSSHRGRIYFKAARARGSRITSYAALCVASHHPTLIAHGTVSPIVVTSLVTDVAYTCHVRAHSVAGYGAYSTTRTIARLP